MTLPIFLAAALTNLTGIITFEREGLPFYFMTDDAGAYWRLERRTNDTARIGDRVPAVAASPPSSKTASKHSP